MTTQTHSQINVLKLLKRHIVSHGFLWILNWEARVYIPALNESHRWFFTPVGRRAEDERRDQMRQNRIWKRSCGLHYVPSFHIHKTYQKFRLHARREDGCGFWWFWVWNEMIIFILFCQRGETPSNLLKIWTCSYSNLKCVQI